MEANNFFGEIEEYLENWDSPISNVGSIGSPSTRRDKDSESKIGTKSEERHKRSGVPAEKRKFDEHLESLYEDSLAKSVKLETSVVEEGGDDGPRAPNRTGGLLAQALLEKRPANNFNSTLDPVSGNIVCEGKKDTEASNSLRKLNDIAKSPSASEPKSEGEVRNLNLRENTTTNATNNNMTTNTNNNNGPALFHRLRSDKIPKKKDEETSHLTDLLGFENHKEDCESPYNKQRGVSYSSSSSVPDVSWDYSRANYRVPERMMMMMNNPTMNNMTHNPSHLTPYGSSPSPSDYSVIRGYSGGYSNGVSSFRGYNGAFTTSPRYSSPLTPYETLRYGNGESYNYNDGRMSSTDYSPRLTPHSSHRFLGHRNSARMNGGGWVRGADEGAPYIDYNNSRYASTYNASTGMMSPSTPSMASSSLHQSLNPYSRAVNRPHLDPSSVYYNEDFSEVSLHHQSAQQLIQPLHHYSNPTPFHLSPNLQPLHHSSSSSSCNGDYVSSSSSSSSWKLDCMELRKKLLVNLQNALTSQGNPEAFSIAERVENEAYSNSRTESEYTVKLAEWLAGVYHQMSSSETCGPGDSSSPWSEPQSSSSSSSFEDVSSLSFRENGGNESRDAVSDVNPILSSLLPAHTPSLSNDELLPVSNEDGFTSPSGFLPLVEGKNGRNSLRRSSGKTVNNPHSVDSGIGSPRSSSLYSPKIPQGTSPSLHPSSDSSPDKTI